MSIINELLNKAKSQDLEEGIHDNCRVLAVDKAIRKDNDGVVIKRNTYIQIGKFDKTGKRKIAEREIAWFHVDPSSEYVMDNFREQIIQLSGILLCYYTQEEVNAQFTIFKGVPGLEDAMNPDTELDVDDIEAALKLKKTATKLLANTIDLFEAMVSNKIGYESKFIQVKFTFDKSGKHIQQPRYGRFTRAMDDDTFSLKISKTESNYSITARDYSKMGEDIKVSDLSNL